jgi:hypothetical protein
LTKDEPHIRSDLRKFLSQAYNLKAVADYEIGPDALIPLDRAEAALETAARFIEAVAELLVCNDSSS